MQACIIQIVYACCLLQLIQLCVLSPPTDPTLCLRDKLDAFKVNCSHVHLIKIIFKVNKPLDCVVYLVPRQHLQSASDGVTQERALHYAL